MVPDPLLPAAYDVVWSVASVVVLTLVIVALVSISRSATFLTSNQALVWTLVAIFLPVLGPVSWLAIGRRSARPGDSSVASSPSPSR